MKVTKLFCDRCMKETTQDTYRKIYQEGNKEYDLCGKCAKLLVKFIEGFVKEDE